MQIAIVDLGVGNLRSVEQAVRTVAPDYDVVVTSDGSVIDSADKVILPGQGAVGSWFRELDQRELRAPVCKALEEKPLLGICVGMQALFEFCEEDGGQPGLGVFDGQVVHFQHYHALNTDSDTADERVSIPQMGWNQVSQVQPHPMWSGIDDQAHFYFLHSYCANLTEGQSPDAVTGSADYHHEFIAAAGRDNVFATQFHPEKSHDDGLQLISNFCGWNGQP